MPADTAKTKTAAPLGVGDAPTRIEERPPETKPQGPGYFERCVVGLKNIVLAFFRWLFRCFDALKQAAQDPPPVKEAPPQLPATPPPAPVDPRKLEARRFLEQLQAGCMPFDLCEQFEAIFPAEEKSRIYRMLGSSVPVGAGENWTHWTNAAIQRRHEETGRSMAKNCPALLVPFLITVLHRVCS
jgi:hypothetical protein